MEKREKLRSENMLSSHISQQCIQPWYNSYLLDLYKIITVEF